MSGLRPKDETYGSVNRVRGQAGLVHPEHVHPRAKRLTGKALKTAVSQHEELVLKRGAALELEALAAEQPKPLGARALGRLFAAIFGGKP